MLVCGTLAGPLLEAGRHGRWTQYPIAITLDVTCPDRCPPGVRPRRRSGALRVCLCLSRFPERFLITRNLTSLNKKPRRGSPPPPKHGSRYRYGRRRGRHTTYLSGRLVGGGTCRGARQPPNHLSQLRERQYGPLFAAATAAPFGNAHVARGTPWHTKRGVRWAA